MSSSVSSQPVSSCLLGRHRWIAWTLSALAASWAVGVGARPSAAAPGAPCGRWRDGRRPAGAGAQHRASGRDAVALISVGGNDLIRGLAADKGPGMRAFEAALTAFVQALRIRPVLMATVYDPMFGDDTKNFLGVDAAIARANHRRVNRIIATLAERNGRVVDLHAHFLHGDASWFTHTIEPSLIGASEVRRAFLAAL